MACYRNVMRWTPFLLLVACEAAPTPEPRRPETAVSVSTPEVTAAPAAEPRFSRRDTHAAECQDHRTELASFQTEREKIRADGKAWMTAHCKPIDHHTVHRDMSGQTIAESPSADLGEWMECDGQLTNALPESPKGAILDQRMTRWNIYLKRCCDVEPAKFDDCGSPH